MKHMLITQSNYLKKNPPYSLMRIKRKIFLVAFMIFAFATGFAQTTDFVITIKTNNPGTSGTKGFTIPYKSFGYVYNYDVDWGDGTTSTAQTASSTHIYSVAGTYTIRISGTYPYIFFASQQDCEKILTVNQWGSAMAWKNFAFAFSNCKNLNIVATDVPDLSQVSNMESMFNLCLKLQGNASFNSWNTASVTNMQQMFSRAVLFNENIGSWNTASVTNMEKMFQSAETFNQNIGSWNTVSVKNMKSMFSYTKLFNQDIESWNTAAVTTMESMFYESLAFNQNLGSWNTSSVTSMYQMFNRARNFNGNLDGWNTASVTNMESMFERAVKFNRDINSWNTARVTDMTGMFSGASMYNQNLGSWNTSAVVSMIGMFRTAVAFNQDISSWNTASVKSMSWMFANAHAFNQSLGNWNITAATSMYQFLENSALSIANYDATLIGWDASNQNPVATAFGASGLKYCAGSAARANLIAVANFTPDGDAYYCAGVLPLPLELISFSCMNENKFNLLLWKTESEVNTKTFVVGKSKDGSSFTTIASLNAIGNGNNNYSHKDADTEGRNYYRLQMMDIDGNFTYSHIIRLNNAQKEAANVYPNPVQETFTLSVNAALLNTHAVLIDAKGMVVQKIKIINQKQLISMANVLPGIYLLKLEDGHSLKVMKK